jgi:hypothetical protein
MDIRNVTAVMLRYDRDGRQIEPFSTLRGVKSNPVLQEQIASGKIVAVQSRQSRVVSNQHPAGHKDTQERDQ